MGSEGKKWDQQAVGEIDLVAMAHEDLILLTPSFPAPFSS